MQNCSRDVAGVGYALREIVNHHGSKTGMNQEMPIWRRTIPESRDKAQSKMLTWVVGVLLMFGAFAPLIAAARLSLPLWPLGRPFLFSAAFAALVLALRAATPAASAIGFLICFILAQAPAEWSRYTPGAVARPLWPALISSFYSHLCGDEIRSSEEGKSGALRVATRPARLTDCGEPGSCRLVCRGWPL